MSLAPFDRAILFILPHETEYRSGHWGDDAFVRTEQVPGDAGGLTKYGIDHRSHPDIVIPALTREGAIAIYHQEWEKHGLDSLPEKLAIAAFDVFVNGGHAIRWLQESYNALHPGRTPLAEDGSLGPKTIAALQSCEQTAVLRLFCQERAMRFRLLSKRPGQSQFLKGWLQRDQDLRKYLEVK